MEENFADLHAVIRTYENYDEDSRLSADNVRRLEFMTTIVYMDQLITPEMRVLDTAAGTGAYALYLASRGMDVTALDITPSYIELLKKKAAAQGLTIPAAVNDARSLADYEDESFDVVLSMGPIYHLPSPSDRDKVMREAMRVLKPGGLLFIAYINKFFIFNALATQNKQYLSDRWYDRIITDGVMCSSDEDCFWTDTWFTTPGEIEQLAGRFGLSPVKHFAQDGTARLLAVGVNAMRPEEFRRWVTYHVRTCEEPSILGVSNHGLYVGKKVG